MPHPLRITMTPVRRLLPAARHPQRGFTLIGLLAWAIVVGMVGYLAVRVLPTVTEFYTIQSAVDRLAAAPANTVPEIRQAFSKQLQIDQTISSIAAKDLDITKENNRVVIAFAYEKEIEIFGPVFLLIKYAGRSK
jgi:type II secretory pathway pseudopilin PulG